MRPVFLVVTRAGLGGAQRVVMELAMQLKEKREVTVVSGEDGWLLEQARAHGMRTRVIAGLGRSRNPFKAIRYLHALYALLRKDGRRPVVHLNSSNALAGSLAAKLAGSRVIFTVHGLSMLDRGYETSLLLRGVYWAWFKLWFRFVDGIVAVSSGNARRIAELKLGTASVIPNGIDTAAIRFMARNEAREELGVPHDAPVAITVGRLEYSKRQEVLIDAWEGVLARVPEARLVLVGDGPEREALQQQATRARVHHRVVFAGARADAASLIPAGDIFVLPSRYEGWPLVLLETLAAGVPALASDVGGIEELLGPAGTLLPARAFPDAWAGAIAALLTEDGRRTELAKVSVARSKRWDAAGMASMYEALYEA